MSRAPLTSFSYAVLALVGREGASPHDVVRMMRRGRAYWTTSPSHYYAEPKRLEARDFLRSAKEPGKTRDRTRYFLTESGRDALAEWLRRPSTFPRIQHEAVVRVLAGDLVDDAALAASVLAMRVDLTAIEAGIDDGIAVAASIPHRERYLRLVHSLGRRLVAAHAGWLDEVERELAPRGERGT